MEAEKFNNLCSHYKDTYDLHRTSIKQRDTLFYSLLIVLAVFTLQISSTEVVSTIVSDYFNKISGIKLGKNADFISTFLWLILFGFTIRYFQVVLEIERQYDYLHKIEIDLNCFYRNSVIFTREGRFYINHYSLFSNWTWFLYAIIFPSFIIFCSIIKIQAQLNLRNDIALSLWVDLICYIMICTTSFLYILQLHKLQRFIIIIYEYLKNKSTALYKKFFSQRETEEDTNNIT